jgi:hypothetical protein
MDRLKIEKAHIHGYSMGGALTGQLLAMIPQRDTGERSGPGSRSDEAGDPDHRD